MYAKDYFTILVEILVGEDGVLSDVTTMVNILPVCIKEADVDMGMGLHGLVVKL